MSSSAKGIKNLSNELNRSGSPVNWYKTLQRQSDFINEQINSGICTEHFDAPIGLQLELTYRCNLKCLHCYNASGQSCKKALLKSELTDAEWLMLAKDVSKQNIFECIISGGEPLIRSSLAFDMMDIISESNVFFILISNGWYLDGHKLKKIQKYRYHYVQISIDGANAATHDKIRGRKGSWERATEAAMMIRDAHLPLCIAATLNRYNFDEMSEIIDLAAYLGAQQVIVDKYMSTGLAATNNDKLKLGENWRPKYFETLRNKQMQYGSAMQVLGSVDPAIQLRLNQLSPNRVALVRPNGDVKLDCITPFVFGNIRNRNLITIWNDKLKRGWQQPEVRGFIASIHADEEIVTANKLLIPHVNEDVILN